MPSLFNPTHITRPLLPFKAVKVFGRCGSRDGGQVIHFGSGRGLRGGGGRPSSGSAALVGVTNCMVSAARPLRKWAFMVPPGPMSKLLCGFAPL